MSRSRYYPGPARLRGVWHDIPPTPDPVKIERRRAVATRDRRHEILDGEIEWSDHQGDYASQAARVAMVHEVHYRGATRRWLTRRQRSKIVWTWVRDYAAAIRAMHGTLHAINAAAERWIRFRKRPVGPVDQLAERYLNAMRRTMNRSWGFKYAEISKR